MKDRELTDRRRATSAEDGPQSPELELITRMRTGELPRAHLEAAAALGEPRAQRALDPGLRREPESWWEGPVPRSATPAWSHWLTEVGEEALLRAGIAMARAHGPNLVASGHTSARRLMERIERHFVETGAIPDAANDHVRRRLQAFLWPAEAEPAPHRRYKEITVAPELVRAWLKSDLVPWLLDDGDPIAARVRSAGG